MLSKGDAEKLHGTFVRLIDASRARPDAESVQQRAYRYGLAVSYDKCCRTLHRDPLFVTETPEWLADQVRPD